MYSSMWFMSIVALLVVDVRTGALQDTDIQPSRCYVCSIANSTACAQPSQWKIIACPAERPRCSTVAIAPDFISTLACAAATEPPCSIRYIMNNSLELTCVCNGQLCNAPFAHEFRIELHNLTSNVTDVKQIFLRPSKYENVSDAELYRSITNQVASDQISDSLQSTMLPPIINAEAILRDSEKPKAEALKQEVTVPSDDDEDEGEGSGTYEESRTNGHSASAPAAPSSFLPANNSATSLYKDLILSTLIVYYLV